MNAFKMPRLKKFLRRLKCFFKTGGLHDYPSIKQRLEGGFTVTVSADPNHVPEKTDVWYRDHLIPVEPCRICGRKDFKYGF